MRRRSASHSYNIRGYLGQYRTAAEWWMVEAGGTLPIPQEGWEASLCSCPRTRGKVRKGVLPCTPNLRGRSGRDSGVSHRQPPAEQKRPPEPQRRLGGGLGAALAGLTPF